MPLRFLAAAGPQEDLAEISRGVAETSSSLVPVLHRPGLAVWVSPQTPWLASDDGSAVAIGTLFESERGVRLQRLPSPLPSPGCFTRRAWGCYLLVVEAPDGHWVLRDPSGGVTCYHRRHRSLSLYASDLAILNLACSGPEEPDQGYLRQWLTYPQLRAAPTGIVGVREVLPGEALVARGAELTASAAWTPWDHARPDRAIASFEDAAAHVREAVLHAVPRLAADWNDVVVQLSGGLDSSIICAALAAADCPFRAVTFATFAPDGDERIHARAVADHCGVELAVLAEDTQPMDFATVPSLALRPPPNALMRALHRILANHFAVTEAGLAIDGTGGDNVFCSLSNASPALDALARQGPRAGLAAIQDLARVHGTTAWAASRAAWRRHRRPRERWPADLSFLAPDAIAEMPAHFWLDAPSDAARGTYEHVRSIVGIRHFLRDPAPGETPALHPLLSQPVLEACLRVPSWLWIRDGRDRAVARAAFGDLLPRAILMRRSKGALQSMFVSGYMAGRAVLEGLLLEGRLAQAEMIDREAVHAYLQRSSQPGDFGYIRLLELASAETWLRSFDG
ncbi:MAG: hypothetical protein B7Z33_03205 [Sphingomonadales bacterium 12-68-11]|nr:MAG: hypothetical protein B7Z33_03205 [Sphingomonadales bacterium 12-68-11]OYX16872.1 MAG: hypothetical protein B7Z07_01665 [Sphingomonadales bacterium 32-67-7]